MSCQVITNVLHGYELADAGSVVVDCLKYESGVLAVLKIPGEMHSTDVM